MSEITTIRESLTAGYNPVDGIGNCCPFCMGNGFTEQDDGFGDTTFEPCRCKAPMYETIRHWEAKRNEARDRTIELGRRVRLYHSEEARNELSQAWTDYWHANEQERIARVAASYIQIGGAV